MSVSQAFAEIQVVLFLSVKRGDRDSREHILFVFFILQKHIVMFRGG